MSLGDIITLPFAWILTTLYNLLHSYGMALVLFSLLLKIILLYFSMKSKKGMLKTTRLSPQIKALEKKYEGNKAKYNEEVQKLYKENEVKPLGGCIWTLIPIPLLFLLYSVVRDPLTRMMNLSADQITAVTNVLSGMGYETSSKAYSQIHIAQWVYDNYDAVHAVVPQVTRIDFTFLGINLATTPDFSFFTKIVSGDYTGLWAAFGLFMIPVLSALLAWLSTKVTTKLTGQDPNAAMGGMKGMTLMMPLMSLWFGFIMPAGMGIYWIANSVFSILQEIWLTKRYNRILDVEDAERLTRIRAAEEDRDKKKAETERLKAENATTRNPNTSRRKVQKVERLEQEQRETEFEKKKQSEKPNSGANRDDEPAKADGRRYARGRAYDPNRFTSEEQPSTEKGPQAALGDGNEDLSAEKNTSDDPWTKTDDE